jgi:hypothetical protein
MVACEEVSGCPTHFAVADNTVAHSAFIGKWAHIWQIQPDAEEHALL